VCSSDLYLISKARSTTFNTGWGIDFYLDTGVFYLDAGTANGSTINRCVSRAALTGITTGVWNHIAVTFDGSLTAANAFKLYRDGVLLTKINDQTTTTVIAANTLTAKIAAGDSTASPGNPADVFNGLIDDLVVYNIALAAAEIAFLASQRGAIYALAAAGGGPINSQSLIRPADSKPYQQLIGA
jgi:hypothetical protein